MTTWRSGMDAMHRDPAIATPKACRSSCANCANTRSAAALAKRSILTRLRDFIPPLIAGHVRQMAFAARGGDRADRGVRGAATRVGPAVTCAVEKLGGGVLARSTCASVSWRCRICRECCTRKRSRCPADLDNATYFSERDFVTGRKRKPRMAAWRRRLFAFLYRNAIHPADRFNLPPQNFVQISRQIEV